MFLFDNICAITKLSETVHDSAWLTVDRIDGGNYKPLAMK